MRLLGLRGIGIGIGLIALFVALGGPATAGQLISGKQIRDSSITTRDVKNRSLRARDFKSGQLPRGATGPQGAQGPQGLPGARGAPGSPGSPGAPGATTVTRRTASAATQASVECLAGETVVGGGAGTTGSTTSDALVENRPFPPGTGAVTGWFARAAGPVTVVVNVLCATP